MDSFEIHKYSNIDINNLHISEFNIKYDNKEFLIQSPIFNDYELLNYNSNKYIELKLDNLKVSHVKFLTFIDSLELKLNNYLNNKSIKTQIITNIQNKKSLKVKLLDNTTFFDSNKNKIDNLYTKKISVLFKLELYKIYYSCNAIQILQLN
jgi:hypothetical protein